MYSIVRSVVLFKEFKMIFLAAILIVSAISIAESIDCDKAENKGHTYCKYQGTSKKHCKDVFVQGMEDKSVPLKLNNYKRLLIANGKTPNQPSAANMCILTWDEESAATAQRWADQCHFGHDNGGAARRTVKYEQCGQNVFRQQSSVKNCTEDWKAALDTFYDEHKVFNTGVKNMYITQTMGITHRSRGQPLQSLDVDLHVMSLHMEEASLSRDFMFATIVIPGTPRASQCI